VPRARRLAAATGFGVTGFVVVALVGFAAAVAERASLGRSDRGSLHDRAARFFETDERWTPVMVSAGPRTHKIPLGGSGPGLFCGLVSQSFHQH
jgi:hypothetical protein